MITIGKALKKYAESQGATIDILNPTIKESVKALGEAKGVEVEDKLVSEIIEELSGDGSSEGGGEEEATGTAEDPIEYVAGVTALEYGKFYIEGGVTYFCVISHEASTSSLAELGNEVASAYNGENMWLGVGYMGDNVAFDNPADLTLTTEDGKNFVAVGSLSKMTEEQATAFGWPDYPDSQYISIYIKELSADNPVVIQGWVSDKDSTDYQTQKSGSTDPGKILGVTMGEELRTDTNDCFVWKCELTNGSVYTIDLTAQAEAVRSEGE